MKKFREFFAEISTADINARKKIIGGKRLLVLKWYKNGNLYFYVTGRNSTQGFFGLLASEKDTKVKEVALKDTTPWVLVDKSKVPKKVYKMIKKEKVYRE